MRLICAKKLSASTRKILKNFAGYWKVIRGYLWAVNEALVNNDSFIFIINVLLLVVFILFHFVLFYLCGNFIEHALNMLIWIYRFLCTRSFISPLVIGEFNLVPNGPRMTFLV